MLFNSIAFLVFLPIVFVAYWSLARAKLHIQNFLLIVVSYIFYGWWDWRFLSLIVISSAVDYFLGLWLAVEERERQRRIAVLLSIFVNLGFLGFFKYFNFFIDSFISLLNAVGLKGDSATLNIVLPVGISFYTFQTLSYSIDVYRRQIEPTKDAIAFFAYVSFFPQLVAGPIERARNFLPQFLVSRSFDIVKAKDGLRQMLWGFFKKIVVADNLADFVNSIFQSSGSQDGVVLLLGTFFFAIQIYCDFSGYSDIAIGCARLFGFNLMRNFAYPYFSRDIAEFWRRWHISLSSWFRDYVYIPLGGSFAGKGRRIWNIVVTFTVSGFWHGANWTFVVWGLLNGLYYIPLMLADRQKKFTDTVAEGRLLPSFREFLAMTITFAMALLAWIFFRAENISHAFSYIGRIFATPYSGLAYGEYAEPLIYALIPLLFEWPMRFRQHGLEITALKLPIRWSLYIVLLIGILVLGNFGSQEFIYFQF